MRNEYTKYIDLTDDILTCIEENISLPSSIFPLFLSLSQVITPFRKLMLCAESRKEMEDWISALKSVQKWETYEVLAF